MNTGQKIKMLRKQKGLTQQELAMELGLKDSAIAKYENGRVINIKQDVLYKMSEVFNCSPSYLLVPDSDELNAFILNDSEKNLVIEYRKASKAMQAIILELLSCANSSKDND